LESVGEAVIRQALRGSRKPIMSQEILEEICGQNGERGYVHSELGELGRIEAGQDLPAHEVQTGSLAAERVISDTGEGLIRAEKASLELGDLLLVTSRHLRLPWPVPRWQPVTYWSVTTRASNNELDS
jgi:hypothetical protein